MIRFLEGYDLGDGMAAEIVVAICSSGDKWLIPLFPHLAKITSFLRK
jgi:hypothetical protein